MSGLGPSLREAIHRDVPGAAVSLAFLPHGVLHFAALKGQEGLRGWLTETGVGVITADIDVVGPDGLLGSFTASPWIADVFGALAGAVIERGYELDVR